MAAAQVSNSTCSITGGCRQQSSWGIHTGFDGIIIHAIEANSSAFSEDEDVEKTRAWKVVCLVEPMFGGPTLPCKWLEVVEDARSA